MMSTRSPGSTKPATPSTSLTRIVIALWPSAITADRVARWPWPVILEASTGSFASMAVSTTRLPCASISWIDLKAPCGSASAGHAISRSADGDSSLPKRSCLLATTSVWVADGFVF
jgi:hypothetical protein